MWPNMPYGIHNNMLAVNVTLEPNIQPKSDPPPSAKTISTY